MSLDFLMEISNINNIQVLEMTLSGLMLNRSMNVNIIIINSLEIFVINAKSREV